MKGNKRLMDLGWLNKALPLFFLLCIFTSLLNYLLNWKLIVFLLYSKMKILLLIYNLLLTNIGVGTSSWFLCALSHYSARNTLLFAVSCSYFPYSNFHKGIKNKSKSITSTKTLDFLSSLSCLSFFQCLSS